MPSEPKRKQVTVNGLRMTYWDWESDGPPILLLHHSAGFGRVWDWIARELHPAYRVIAPDLRGHGDTDQPSTGYAAEDHARDIEDLVRQLGLRRFALGGYSLGSRVAMIYAAEHPEQVSHLLLIGGPHYVSLVPDQADSDGFFASAAQMRTSPRRFASLAEAKAALRKTRPYLDDAGLDHILEHNMNRDASGAVEWKYDPVAVAEGLEHIPDDLKPYVARIQCSVFLPRPEHSREITPERVPHLEPYFPRGRWMTIAGAEKVLQLEQPVVLAKAIRGFLEERRD